LIHVQLSSLAAKNIENDVAKKAVSWHDLVELNKHSTFEPTKLQILNLKPSPTIFRKKSLDLTQHGPPKKMFRARRAPLSR
jgi:hypothetical protein